MKAKNKNYLRTILVILQILLLTFFIYINYIQAVPILAQLGVDSSQVNKVKIFNGNTGVKKTITDKNEVSDIVNMFDSVDVKHYKAKRSMTVGFSFEISFYRDDVELTAISPRSDCQSVSDSNKYLNESGYRVNVYKATNGKYDLNLLKYYSRKEGLTNEKVS